MKDALQTRLITFVTMCSLSAPGLALVGGGLANQASPISREVEKRVEQKASQAAERATERHLEKDLEKRLERQPPAQTDRVRERLEELPETLPILTSDGQRAFNDVILDDGFRAVESQWLVTGTDSEIARLEQADITILERTELSGLGMTLARFRVSPELDSREALERALPELADRLDRNHIYAPQTKGNDKHTEVERPQWQSLCTEPVRIGMVDTAIETDHPVFAAADIVQEPFLEVAESKGKLAEAHAHGTAVASLMVGERADQWRARLPEATLFNASVFYGRDADLSGATLGHLLEGLNWLADQQLSVINISLTGPDNRLLQTAVKALQENNVTLVAAVGNQGPAASPLYPAAYPEVVGVTAVDSAGELYRWANRGQQVMFAGPGVAVPVAGPEGKLVADSGTSLAAPVIAAALACQRAGSTEEAAIDALIEKARDLGKPGRDKRFGHGFLDL